MNKTDTFGPLHFVIEIVLVFSIKVKTTRSKQERYLGEYQKEVITHTDIIILMYTAKQLTLGVSVVG